MSFIVHFYSLLINTCIQVQINHFEAFQIFGNMIRLSESWGSCFGCEDLILLCFCHQMLNTNMLKATSEICLKCKYQLKQKTITKKKKKKKKKENHNQRKDVATDKKCIPSKIDLEFPNPKFNLLCIIAFISI